ncbi:beta-galactosidase [Fusarium sp. NRRL 52700]|nr:beta-galactosidase [Fusarium sp. NRRL 52700]
MQKDLLLMKRSNINAIRTAHQPPHPDFFDVADDLGFYVIAKCDLECHGFGGLEETEEEASEWLSNNPDWEEAYVDRARQPRTSSFGDEPKDGDFIMDGLVLSDHSPMPLLKEYAKVIQPISVKLAKNGSAMMIIDHYDLLGLSCLDVSWHVVAGGLKTNNDAVSSGDGPIWELKNIPIIYPQGCDVTWRVDDDGAVVHYKAWVVVKTRAWGVEADIIYKTPTSRPQLQLETLGEFVGKNESHVIPRIGLIAVLPESFNDVSWFGRGLGESYKGSKQSSQIGESTGRRYMPFDLDDAQHPHTL